MNIEQRNERRHSLLVIGILGNSSNVIKKLLELEVDVNARLSDFDYGNALAAAAQRGNECIVQQLLDSGADANMQLSSGRYGSALAAAEAPKDNKWVAQLLREYGAR